VSILPHEAKQHTWFCMGGSGLDRTDDFQKFADKDWIGFNFVDQDWTRTEKFHSPLISARGAITQVPNHSGSAEILRGRRMIAGAPKNLNNVARTFFNTVYLASERPRAQNLSGVDSGNLDPVPSPEMSRL